MTLQEIDAMRIGNPTHFMRHPDETHDRPVIVSIFGKPYGLEADLYHQGDWNWTGRVEDEVKVSGYATPEAALDGLKRYFRDQVADTQ